MTAFREKFGFYLTDGMLHADELLAQSFANAEEHLRLALSEKIAQSI